MERMEVDQNACATAGGGGTSLRRSNSAPMITNLSDSATVLEPVSSKCRRSSVSINLSCPGLVFPVSPFRLSAGRSDALKQEESMDITHRDNTLTRGMSAAMQSISLWDKTCISPVHIHHSGVTPNPSPSPTRRFGRMNLQSSPLGSLKRKGGIEVDSPPNKLFVAGVPGPASSESVVLKPMISHSLSAPNSLENLTVVSSSQSTQMSRPPATVATTLPSAPAFGFSTSSIPATHPSGM